MKINLINSSTLPKRVRLFLVSFALALVATVSPLRAQPDGGANPAIAAQPVERSGQHDFDFVIGSWKIHLKRLVHPLTGSTTWVEFDGTDEARKLFGGRANLDQFAVKSTAGLVEGLTLRMYSEQAHQWSIYWGNMKDGSLGQPVIPTVGSFKDGRGEFYDQEPYNGRMIFVRYVWSAITATSAHFEQSFSTDGGKTWEVNWITDQVRTDDAASG